MNIFQYRFLLQLSKLDNIGPKSIIVFDLFSNVNIFWYDFINIKRLDKYEKKRIFCLRDQILSLVWMMNEIYSTLIVSAAPTTTGLFK